MALVHSPISIQEALNDISSQISYIRRKTNTLIDYYIFPEPTPSEISAYEPRLKILQDRLKTLSKISYPNLAHLLDDSDALAAGYLNAIIDQLLNGVHGITEIFQEHYDRTLEDRKPFEIIYAVLEHREKQLKDIIHNQMTDSRKLRPEDLRPNEIGYFCRGAIQMVNRRDRGKITQMRDRELLDENKARLKRYGGAYLWWECNECAFRLRYHVTNSITSSIHSTDEIRDHDSVPVEYKSTFLIKCHTYQPPASTTSSTRGNRNSFSLFGGSSAQDRERGTISASAMKYACPFCFASGRTLERGTNAFATSRDIANHLVQKHRKVLPPGPLLQKYNVAMKNKCAEGVRRWDINFK
jgi:hypothetical protein